MNLQNLPWWARLLLFVVLAAAVVFLGYKTYPNFSDMQKKIDGKKDELAQLQAEIQKGEGALKRRAELERQIQIKEAELALLRRILPTEPETGDLVKWLKAQADQVNLDLQSFTRGAVTEQEFLSEHTYAMAVVGEYHDLGDFFERVSGHDRLVNVKNLTITANTGSDRFTRSVRANFTAVTFVYKEGSS
jgi:type IV pilus assembly protein PilO